MRRVSNAVVLGFALVWLVCAGAVTSAQPPGGSPDAKKLKNPVPSTAASIAAGKQTFDKYCKFCHGAEAKGDGPMAPKDTHPSDLTDDKWDRGSSDGDIFVVISDGAGPKFDMKGFKSKLTEKEMWNVVNYLRSLGPKATSR